MIATAATCHPGLAEAAPCPATTKSVLEYMGKTDGASPWINSVAGQCEYLLRCPDDDNEDASSLGITDLEFRLGLGSSLEFVNATVDATNGDGNVTDPLMVDWTATAANSTFQPTVANVAYDQHRALFPFAQNVAIRYNEVSTAAGINFFFRLKFQCFTDLCPDALTDLDPANSTASEEAMNSICVNATTWAPSPTPEPVDGPFFLMLSIVSSIAFMGIAVVICAWSHPEQVATMAEA